MKRLEDFSAFYFQHRMEQKVPDFHYEIMSLMERKNRIAVAAPRYFAKSTLSNIFYLLWRLLDQDDNEAMIVSATAPLAEKWLSEIKYEMESNEELISDYEIEIPHRDRVANARWGRSIAEFLTRGRRVRIYAKGREFQVRGFHPKVLVIDDLEQDDAVLKPEAREKLREWFNRALLRMLGPGDRAIMIGTVMHLDSLLSNVIARKDWNGKIYKALDEKDVSLWESRWPAKELIAEREMDIYGFMAERQNTPTSARTVIVRSEWIQEPERDSNGKRIMPQIVDSCFTALAASKISQRPLE